jgi:two-component system, cell cycle sensor histidine kinase and response regulator CckA
MAAEDRAVRHEPQSLVGRLTHLVARLISPTRRSPVAAPQSSSTIDVGDLRVARLVHDLRNQLTIILACADNLAAADSAAADPDVCDLQRAAERAGRLTREILSAARPRYAARRPTEVNDVVRRLASTLDRMMPRGITVRLDLSANPLTVVAEPLELERIVLNLALNGRDAMGGEGVLTITTSLLDTLTSPVHGVMPGRHVCLRVTDTGSGLTSAVRARMFQPFFTTTETGTGLGLSAVASVAQQLFGTVLVNSEHGQGTAISVVLPLVDETR